MGQPGAEPIMQQQQTTGMGGKAKRKSLASAHSTPGPSRIDVSLGEEGNRGGADFRHSMTGTNT